MKLFIGGWALGTLVGGTLLFCKASKGDLFDFYLWAGLVIGPLAGLAAWGLL